MEVEAEVLFDKEPLVQLSRKPPTLKCSVEVWGQESGEIGEQKYSSSLLLTEDPVLIAFQGSYVIRCQFSQELGPLI